MGLKSEDAYTTELRTVLCIAQALREAISIPCPPSCSLLGTSNVIDTTSLPIPQPLLPSLLEAGITSEIASVASQIYQRRAGELKQYIQDSVTTIYRKAAEYPVSSRALPPDLLMKKVVRIFTDIYFGRLEEWKKEIIQRVKQASKSQASTVLRNSRTFNYEYVPLLEHFFEENSFPTHADKMFLAKKSNMEYRQIHVWFQNRRNRSKKEGKALRKQTTYEQATKPLDKLYERMKGHMVDPDSQASKPSKAVTTEIKITQNSVSRDSFASSSPTHAFPSSYPPTCHYDPFPCKSGPICFSKPEWRRVPDGKHPLPLSTSINDLVERFSHLNVRDGTHSKGSPKLQSHAATAAITVIPSPAPHPSLIVRNYHQPKDIVQLRQSVCAPVSCSKAFQSPSPPKSVTLVPLSAPPNKSELPGKRKTAPLPQRFSGRMRNIHRDATPSESSSTTPSSPPLFSTDLESRSCCFSSVSSLSTPSDAANIRELPHLSRSQCHSPFDSPIHLHGLGNMVAIWPSSIS